MKKATRFVGIVLASVLVVGMLSGCGAKKEAEKAVSAASSAVEEAASAAEEAASKAASAVEEAVSAAEEAASEAASAVEEAVSSSSAE